MYTYTCSADACRAIKAHAENAGVLRFAVADIFLAQDVDIGHGTYLQVRSDAAPSKANYGVGLEHIRHKIAWCDGTLSNPAKPRWLQKVWRFVAYSNTYTRKDPEAYGEE